MAASLAAAPTPAVAPLLDELDEEVLPDELLLDDELLPLLEELDALPLELPLLDDDVPA